MSSLITKVDAYALRVPLTTVFVGSTYTVSERWTVITEMWTDDGVHGCVYNGDPRDDAIDIAEIIISQLAPIVVGRDALDGVQLWSEMFARSFHAKDKRMFQAALSAVDCAIWDVRARMADITVAQYLGGGSRSVPVIAIAGYYGSDRIDGDLADEMAAFREQGLAGCKMKVGGLSPGDDAKRVAAAREGGGDGFSLSADANRAWTVEEALEFADLVQDYDLEWFEEPCHWHSDRQMMERVSRHTKIPICAGQNELSSHGVADMLVSGGVDIVNFDASDGGGVTEWQRSAAVAFAMSRRIAHHEEPQIALHLLASTPGAMYVECFPSVERDPIFAGLLTNPPVIANGVMHIPSGPGFGLEFVDDFVRRHRV